MKKQILPVKNCQKKEICQQPNEISQAHFYGSSTSYKLIIFALFKTLQCKNFIDPEKKNVYIGFSKKEFCKHLDITITGNVIDGIEKSAKELGKSLITVKVNDRFVVMPWFEKIEVMNNGDVNFKFNQSIAEYFNFKIGYSALELLEIGELQSFYALRYYALAKSKSGYKNGWFEYLEDELRELFDLKDKYPRRNTFVEKVIKKPIEEINEKTTINILLESEKIDVGKYKWRFTCCEKSKKIKIAKSDSFEKKQEKIAINNEADEIEIYKKKYPKEFSEIYKLEKSQQNLFGFSLLAESNVVQKLKEMEKAKEI